MSKIIAAHCAFIPLIYASCAFADTPKEKNIDESPQNAKVSSLQCESSFKPVVITQKNKQRKALREYNKYKIHSITIENKPIFDTDDPEEDYWIYRQANKIQTRTKEYVIRNQILFEEGENFNLADVEESLRILRDREYILDVSLRIDAMCDEGLKLVITVRDAWVIEPQISYGRQGGEDSSGIGFRHGNFMGSGNAVTVAYEKDSERSRMEYRFATSHLFNKRLDFEVYHADLSDGADQKLKLSKPFFAYNTKTSFNIETSTTTIEERIRFNNEETNRYLYKTELDTAHIGAAISINKKRAYRVLGGVTQKREIFDEVDKTVALPEAKEKNYAWLRLDRVTNDFEQFSNLSYIGRKQDIPIGTRFSTMLGFGQNEAEEDIVIWRNSYASAVAVSDSHLIQLSAYTDITEATDGEQRSTTQKMGFESNYFFFINGKNRWYAHWKYDFGNELEEHEQFTVGEVSGLRGYPLAYQRGDRRYIINMERRFYSDIHWFNLIRVGAVGFVDIGHAWGSEEYDDKTHLASAGIGLRAHTSKSGTPVVLHLNLATPLVKDGNLDSYLVSFSMESTF